MCSDIPNSYKVSKLLLLYFVRDLAAKNPYQTPSTEDIGFNKPTVMINYITPGACATDIFRDDVNWIQKTLMDFAVKLIARTPEEGSRTILAAASPILSEQEHGAFLMDCKVAK